MTEEQLVVYNKNATLLYKDTEIRFSNDEEVDADDLHTMCNILYQRELLDVFGMSFTEEPNFVELTNRMESVYERVKTDPCIMELMQQYFFQDELSTFFSLFSYDTLHIIHKLICNCL